VELAGAGVEAWTAGGAGARHQARAPGGGRRRGGRALAVAVRATIPGFGGGPGPFERAPGLFGGRDQASGLARLLIVSAAHPVGVRPRRGVGPGGGGSEPRGGADEARRARADAPGRQRWAGAGRAGSRHGPAALHRGGGIRRRARSSCSSRAAARAGAPASLPRLDRGLRRRPEHRVRARRVAWPGRRPLGRGRGFPAPARGRLQPHSGRAGVCWHWHQDVGQDLGGRPRPRRVVASVEGRC